MGGKQACEGWSIAIRLLACLSSIASLVLLLKSKQTVQASVGLDYIAQQVKYSDTSALIYLVFSNTLVAVYCFLALVSLIPAALGMCQSGKAGRWTIFVLDQLLAYVLLAAASSATEVAYLAKNGMTKTSWAALCSTYGHFCRMMNASIGFSFAAVVLLTLLSVMSARSLFHFYTRPLFAMKMRHTSLI